MAEKIRLNKFISDSGVCSRREADKHIEGGHVVINNRRAKIGDMVAAAYDRVLLNGNLIEAKESNEYIFMAFNKPVGIVSTTEIGARDSIIDYIGFHERIFPIGRLDKESQGLIFLTNNGDIVNKILRAGNQHEKEYIVTVDKPITDDFIFKMGNSVPILGEMTKKCKVVKESVYTFRITLIQGLNRQIRRMCEHFAYNVLKLERVRIMNINLKGIGLGEWRILDEKEMAEIMDSIANSSSETPIKTKNADTQKKLDKKRSDSRTKNGNRAPSAKQKKPDRSSVENPKSRELRKNKTSDSRKAGPSNRNSSPRRFNK
jgi:23S rRNA pseudouridine2604 synthase